MDTEVLLPPAPDTTRIVIDAYGGTTKLTSDTMSLPPPLAGEVCIRHTAIGVNYVDIYHRTGLYSLPALPAVLGVEAAGVIAAVGPGVESLRIGQRVAYAGLPTGSYATMRNLAAERVIALPDDVDEDEIASLLLRGITAHMLFNYAYRLNSGDTVLVHAAAGGLGLVLVQWAKTLGASVIGTVGSPAKADLAIRHGLDHAILYRAQDFVATTKELNQGEGVDYAIDGIGGKTLRATLDVVKPFGMVASIGQVSGDPGPFELSLLGPARSIALSRPSVFRFMRDTALYREGAQATITRLQKGLKANIGEILPLRQAAEAHRKLESGETTGSILLRP